MRFLADQDGDAQAQRREVSDVVEVVVRLRQHDRGRPFALEHLVDALAVVLRRPALLVGVLVVEHAVGVAVHERRVPGEVHAELDVLVALHRGVGGIDHLEQAGRGALDGLVHRCLVLHRVAVKNEYPVLHGSLGVCQPGQHGAADIFIADLVVDDAGVACALDGCDALWVGQQGLALGGAFFGGGPENGFDVFFVQRLMFVGALCTEQAPCVGDLHRACRVLVTVALGQHAQADAGVLHGVDIVAAGDAAALPVRLELVPHRGALPVVAPDGRLEALLDQRQQQQVAAFAVHVAADEDDVVVELGRDAAVLRRRGMAHFVVGHEDPHDIACAERAELIDVERAHDHAEVVLGQGRAEGVEAGTVAPAGRVVVVEEHDLRRQRVQAVDHLGAEQLAAIDPAQVEGGLACLRQAGLLLVEPLAHLRPEQAVARAVVQDAAPALHMAGQVGKGVDVLDRVPEAAQRIGAVAGGAGGRVVAHVQDVHAGAPCCSKDA